MAAETKAYAKYRNQLGETTYQWSIIRWDDELGDNIILADGEEPGGSRHHNLPAQDSAREAARKALFEHPDANEVVIVRGEYRESVIHDPDVGTVLDADWIQDERWIEHGWPLGHRGNRARVEWEEEEW